MKTPGYSEVGRSGYKARSQISSRACGKAGSRLDRQSGIQPGNRISFRLGFLSSVVMLAFVPVLALPVAAQDLVVNNIVVGGSVEARVVHTSGPVTSSSEAASGSVADTNSYRAELAHRGLWELNLDENRFVLAHELVAATDGNPDLLLEQAYLTIGLDYSGRLDIGRQEVPLGLGSLFEPVDPLAGTDGRSVLDGLALVLNPWANHGLKAVLALDGLWDGGALYVDGTDGTNGGDLLLGEAWRRLFFGLRYDGLVGSWEPGLAFFFRDGEFLRLAASSRLGLGSAIIRLEGAWDFEQPYLYPLVDETIPGEIAWQPRVGTGYWPGGGGMGLVGIDLYLYPADATVLIGVEYAYQSRGFDRQERLLALVYTGYLAGVDAPPEPAWVSGLHAGQWDSRHKLGFLATVQPWDRLSLSILLVLGMDYPEGVASCMAEAGVELNQPENVDLLLHLRQTWEGGPWDGESLFSTAVIGFRVHY